MESNSRTENNTEQISNESNNQNFDEDLYC